jgi:hypothetical protein
MIKQLFLPTDFIFDFIEKRVGNIIEGRMENETLYTNSFVQKEKKRILGCFSAVK